MQNLGFRDRNTLLLGWGRSIMYISHDVGGGKLVCDCVVVCDCDLSL